MAVKPITLFTLLALLVPVAALAQDRGASWFHVKLKDGTRMTVKFLRENRRGYDAIHDGYQIIVDRESIEKAVSVADSGVIGGKPHAASLQECEEILDRIEELGSLDHARRRSAIEDLAGRFPVVRPFLHEALHHKARRVRQLAAQILGEQREGEKDREAVLELLKDSNERVRMHALFAIRKLGRGGVKRLLQHFETESSINNRKLVIKTLEHWDVKEAIEPFAEALASEKDRGVQFFLVNALESLTGKNYGNDVARWLRHVGRSGDAPAVVPGGAGPRGFESATPSHRQPRIKRAR